MLAARPLLDSLRPQNSLRKRDHLISTKLVPYLADVKSALTEADFGPPGARSAAKSVSDR